MISSSASRSLPKASIGKQSNPCGGNLARPNSTRTGHSSFAEFPEQFPAQVSNASEIPVGPYPSRKWAGAAYVGRLIAHAKSRPFPFIEVDYLTHRDGSKNSLIGIGEHRRTAFHEVGKIVHERAG